MPSWKSGKGNTEKKSWKVAGKELNLMDKQEVMAFQTHSNNVKLLVKIQRNVIMKRRIHWWIFDKSKIKLLESGIQDGLKCLKKLWNLDYWKWKKNYGTKVENVLTGLKIGMQ